MSTGLDAASMYVYASGLVHMSVCVPVTMSRDQVAETASEVNPTGITSQWAVSGEPFADGSPNPCPCDTEPDDRRHYLLVC